MRAGMVADPGHCRWSSYRASAFGAPDSLPTAHPLYLALGADDDARRAAYRDLFEGALDEKPLADLRLALNQAQPIGNDRFSREIEAIPGEERAQGAQPSALGRRLQALRQQALLEGMSTLTQDEVLAEVRRRRGEPIEDA